MKNLPILLFLGCTAALHASNSVLTNTVITDPDGQTWNNCGWSAALNSPNGPPTISGVRVAASALTASGSCSSVGKITATLTDTGSLDQSGATWVFTLTPNASSIFPPTVISTTAVTGATPNLSTVLSAVQAPRFTAGATSYGYVSGEVQNPIFGSIFFDVTGGCTRQFSLAGWSTCAASGGGGCTSTGATGTLQKSDGAGGCVASSILDNGTIVVTPETIRSLGYNTTGQASSTPTASAAFDFCIGACGNGTSTGTARIFDVGPDATHAGDIQMFGLSSDASIFKNFMTCIGNTGVCDFGSGNGATIAGNSIPSIVGTPLASQSLCLLAVTAGTPTIGKCTSVVGAGGACTCVSF